MGEEKRRAGGDQLSESEAYEFATCVLSNEHMTPELQAFTFAWKGSINSQSEQGSSTLASSALQFDDFYEWLSLIASSCRFPEGPNDRPAN